MKIGYLNSTVLDRILKIHEQDPIAWVELDSGDFHEALDDAYDAYGKGFPDIQSYTDDGEPTTFKIDDCEIVFHLEGHS